MDGVVNILKTMESLLDASLGHRLESMGTTAKGSVGLKPTDSNTEEMTTQVVPELTTRSDSQRREMLLVSGVHSSVGCLLRYIQAYQRFFDGHEGPWILPLINKQDEQ